MTRRPLAILAAVLLAGLLVAAALHGLDALAYVLAALVICVAIREFNRGAERAPREVEELKTTAARTPRVTIDGPARKGGDPSAPVMVARPRLTLVRGGGNRWRPIDIAKEFIK